MNRPIPFLPHALVVASLNPAFFEGNTLNAAERQVQDEQIRLLEEEWLQELNQFETKKEDPVPVGVFEPENPNSTINIEVHDGDADDEDDDDDDNELESGISNDPAELDNEIDIVYQDQSDEWDMEMVDAS